MWKEPSQPENLPGRTTKGRSTHLEMNHRKITQYVITARKMVTGSGIVGLKRTKTARNQIQTIKTVHMHSRLQSQINLLKIGISIAAQATI